MEKYFRTSVCPYDCPDACGLMVETDGNKIYSVKGDPDHPVTCGYLCRKMQHYEKDINSPERITVPYRRMGEKGQKESFVPITWDEAVKTICDRWKDIGGKYGYDTIVPYSYAGTMGYINRHSGLAFFARLGAANLTRTICSSARGAGEAYVMGDFNDWPAEHIPECDLIILWSSNPMVNQLHTVPFLKQAKKNGARIIMINVRACLSAELCDEVILVNPGSDAALIAAMLNVLETEGMTDREFISEYTEGYEELKAEFMKWTPEKASEVCGVPAEKITELAHLYGRASRPVTLGGGGMSRYTNGSSSFRALMYLPAVTGAWKRGGGTVTTGGSCNYVDKSYITKPEWASPSAQKINMCQLGIELAKPDSTIKSLYVYHSNPAVMTPDQQNVIRGLHRDDLFTVVHDRFFTDTALLADIILPADFSVEHDDIFTSYGYYHLQVGNKVVQAPGEARSNWETWCLLAEGMGFEEEFFRQTEKDIIEKYFENREWFGFDISDEQIAELKAGHAIYMGQPDIMAQLGSGDKIKLTPPREIFFPLEDQKYPLRFVSSNSPWSLNSNFSFNEELMEKRGKISVYINSEDAAERGISDGDLCEMYNDFGKIRVLASVTPEIVKGAVSGEGVHQMKYTFGDGNFCSIMGPSLTDAADASTLNTNTVEIRKI